MQPSPRYSDSFSNLAERRQWISQVKSKTKPVLAWPTAERLSRLDSPESCAALLRYCKIMNPRERLAANDNDGAISDFDVDSISEIKPSIGAMLTSASNGLRNFVISSKIRARWVVTKRNTSRLAVNGSEIEIGGLRFRRGAMVNCGSTSPSCQTRAPKGYKTPPRTETSIRYLLPANDNTPIAKGAAFLGGITRAKGIVTKPGIGDHEAAAELEHTSRQRAIRLALADHARILDLAIGDATAKEIGEILGYTGKTAERRGIAAINTAIEKFKEISG